MAPITTYDPTQPRRKDLIERLQKHGIHVINRNRISGKANLMALYDSTAILINVHQIPHHRTLEEFRVLPALLRGVVIVCENSPLTDAPVLGMELDGRHPIQGFGGHEQLRRILRKVLRPAIGASLRPCAHAANRLHQHGAADPEPVLSPRCFGLEWRARELVRENMISIGRARLHGARSPHPRSTRGRSGNRQTSSSELLE